MRLYYVPMNSTSAPIFPWTKIIVCDIFLRFIASASAHVGLAWTFPKPKSRYCTGTYVPYWFCSMPT